MIQDILPRHLDNQFRWLTPQKSDIILLFEGSSVLAKWQDEKIYYPDYEEFCTQTDAAKYTFIYVLSVDEIQYFLAMRKGEVLEGSFQGELSDAKVHEEYQSELDGYDFLGVNIFRSAVPKYRAFAAITAYHLYGWYRDNRFCGRCGKPMVHDKKERMVRCMCCNNMVFPKICPAVIIGVTDGDRILLTKYAGRTYKNYALVAGFTEIGETLEQTVEREVMEEVGLHVKNIRYYKSQPWALSGSLLAGFFCELDGDDTISLQEDELSVGKWAHADDLELEDDGISLTREMILKFKEEHAKRKRITDMRQKIYAYIEDEFSIFHDFMWKWSSMLNFLWAAMIVIGIVYGAFTGNMTAVSDGALDSAKEAVTLCITMLGVMSLWTGLMEIANRSGLIDKCTKAILPLMQWLFPGVPKDHDAMQHITTNVIANFLGLGWAATPAGLRAMKALSELNVENSRASTDMCTFLVINISSIQLIPVNIIAYRSQYGSVNPTAIVAPAILATTVSTLAAIVFCKIMAGKSA